MDARRLLHRWFVEYNPFYLVSALLVLGGTIAMASGLGQTGNPAGLVAVAGLVEAYAIALIGGATLLYRLGQRRSAVLLGFLAALYQGDLMLHTEACPNLGVLGQVAALGWLALSVAKLVALVRGFALRPNRAAHATAILGAVGLAALPWLPGLVAPRTMEAAVFFWLFAIAETAARAKIDAKTPLAPWPALVLARSVKVLAGLGVALLVLHVGFWASQRMVALLPLFMLVPLVAVRTAGRPRAIAGVVALTLFFVACCMPECLAMTAAVAAVAVGLRARNVTRTIGMAAPSVSGPYRLDPVGPATVQHERDLVAERRLWILAAGCAWLACVTVSWRGGPWPSALPVHLAFAAFALVAAWRWRLVLPLVPVVLGGGEHVLERVRIPHPESAVGWGATAFAVGFVLLIASLAVSYRLRDDERQSQGH